MANQNKNKMERVYLSKLVGKEFEVVYNKLYETDKGYQVRIKLDDGEKMLLMNENEAKFYGKLFKKGNKLKVEKNGKYYKVVQVSEKSKKQNDKKTKDVKKEISDLYMKKILVSGIKQFMSDLRKSLLEKEFDEKSVDKVLNYLNDEVINWQKLN